MSNHDAGILSLSGDELAHVFKFLEYFDLLRCGLVCRKFYEVSIRDQLWKSHCIKHWDIKSVESEQSSWRSSFVDRYREDGQYINFYLKIRKAWKQIETVCEKFCPEIYRSLQAGLSEVQIDSLESQYNMRLPSDMRCAYKFHNGQSMNCMVGLLGSVRVYNLYSSEVLLPLDVAIKNVEYLFVDEMDKSLLPLTYCKRTKQSQVIALDGAVDFNVGQIFYLTLDTPETRDVFFTADSFLNWFCSYADQLARDSFPYDKREILKFYHEPECTARTGSITVTAATAFVPSQTSVHPPKFFHAYRITMSMDASARENETCKLSTRHWIITDANGREERVDGEGVIGEYPVMKPGAKYSYVSCCPMSTTYGSMTGHFSFENSSTDQTIDVACPLFHLRAPPHESGVERKKRHDEQRKKGQ